MSSNINDKVEELKFIETISAAAQGRFANMRALDEYETPTARFYAYPDLERPWALVKVFRNNSEAAGLYLQEIDALYWLRSTGRVCEVLCDSGRHDPNSWERDFEGPYFIAKYFFKNRLDEVLEQATDLDKLDLAAQLVDISREFLKAGWRDWDWRVENDFVGESGRLLRVDLDSAAPLHSLIHGKASIEEPRYFCEEDRVRLEKFIKERNRLIQNSWSNEVTNSAIRLAHIFCPDNQHPTLQELIKKLQALRTAAIDEERDGKESTGDAADNGDAAGKVDATETSGAFLKFKTRASNLIRRATAKAFGAEQKDEVVVAEEETNAESKTDAPGDNDTRGNEIRLDWQKLWASQGAQYTGASPPSLDSMSRLGRDEIRILSDLFFLLISEPTDGFSLDDLHASLVLLEKIALDERVTILGGIGRRSELLIDLARYTRFFELRYRRRALAGRGRLRPAQPPDKDTPRPERKEKIKTRFVKKDAGYWTANQKNKCEDRALTFEGEHVAVAAVIDGVTDANGFDAAELAKAELEEWRKGLDPTSRDSLEDEARSVLLKINSRLLQAFSETSKQHQAAVMIAALWPDEDACYVAIAQGGDSSCVIYWRDGDERASIPQWGTSKLGVSEKAEIRSETVRLRLDGNASTAYRVRLFSDGVGKAAQARLRDKQDVGELIEEAASWPLKLEGAVGHDDWAVAGIDLVLEKEETETSQPEQESGSAESAPAPQDESLESALNFNHRDLELGERAKKFWREALRGMNQDKAMMKYRPVLDLIGPNVFEQKTERREPPAPQKEAPKSQVAVGYTARAAEKHPEEHFNFPLDGKPQVSARRLFWIFFGVALIAGSIAGLFMYLTSGDRKTPPPENKNVQTKPEGQGQPVIILTQSQKRMYDILEGRSYPVGGLPGGGDLNDDLKSQLKDLAQVIKGKGLGVSIDVFASPGGTAQKNLRLTEKRADAVKTYLVKELEVPEGRVEVTGRGWPNDSQKRIAAPYVDTNKSYVLISLKPPEQ